MTEAPKSPGCAAVLFPVWGLASAGGAVGFFGGFWVLPLDWWPAGVVAGVAGGAVIGWLLARRVRPVERTPESVHGDTVE